MHAGREGAGGRDVNHGVERRQQQHRRVLQTGLLAGGDGLAPDVPLHLRDSGLFCLGRGNIWQLSIGCQPRLHILPEPLSEGRLGGRRQQVQPQVGGANGIGLLDDQLPPDIEPRGSSREGEGYEQPQEAEHRTLDDPALRCRAISIVRSPPDAEPPTRFQQEQHAEK